MSPRLTLGDVTNDFDERLVNLVRAFEADADNPDRLTILWLIANLQHARSALRLAINGHPYSRVVFARQGLEVVGEDEPPA